MAKMNWVPASNPPKTQENILFASMDGVYLGYYDGDDFCKLGAGYVRYGVVWWMPVPPLPSGGIDGWKERWCTPHKE